jgi:hypothetical protein
MARKDEFNPPEDQVFQMKTIVEGDYTYGHRMMEAYLKCFDKTAIGRMFEAGVTGMVFGDDHPKGKEFLDEVISSTMYSRPEDYNDKKGVGISGGQFVKTSRQNTYPRSLRYYDEVRFQGDFAKLCDVDWPEEGRGSMAVSLIGNLAIQGFLPRQINDSIILRTVTLAVMGPDDDHEEAWYSVEFDLYVHKDNASYVPLPHDNKTGYVPVDVIEECVKEVYG